MGAFIDRLRNEPVLVTQIVAAVLSLLVVLGFSLPVGTAAALMSIAQVIAGLIGRSQVTPTRNLPDGDAAPDPALGVTS
jgi:hypothetical protein